MVKQALRLHLLTARDTQKFSARFLSIVKKVNSKTGVTPAPFDRKFLFYTFWNQKVHQKFLHENLVVSVVSRAAKDASQI